MVSAGDIEKIVCKAITSKDLLNRSDTSFLVYDLDQIDQRVDDLFGLFPGNTLHAIAVKALPLLSIVKLLQTKGAGFETASLPELYLALKSGADPGKVVFDSPVKTPEEIEFALKAGVYLNADNLDELDRIAALKKRFVSPGRIGLRINPQVGNGKIKITSVAGEYSKFGVPVKLFRQKIIKAYLEHQWLTGIHVHIGSQGCDLPLLVRGIKVVYDLANEINRELENAGCPNRISTFDLGGGLPVAYLPEDHPPSMKDYVSALKNEMPGLFDGSFRLITEFGRWVYANAGFTVSRVEYVKPDGDNPDRPDGQGGCTLMIHVGADLLIRECYLPEQWPHRFSVADEHGKIKTGPPFNKYTIAGPLCFQGDIVARNIQLPEVHKGDHIIIHDTGAYTLGMWSRYNSRQMPKVIGCRRGGDFFEILKNRETTDDIIRFWG